MNLFDRFRWNPNDHVAQSAPRASIPSDAGVLITNSEELQEALRAGFLSDSGVAVTADTAMRVGAVYACIRIRSGSIANLPFDVMRRVDDHVRLPETKNDLWRVVRRRPNRWQKPAQFKRMMQAHQLLKGQSFALIGRGALGGVKELVPLHPDRVKVEQQDDLSLVYLWTRKDGRQIRIQQRDMLHLYTLTLDGINGITPLTYARETIGLALGLERHAAKVIKNGARVSGALKSPKKLSDPAFNNLKQSIEEYKSGGDKEGSILLLEEGLEFEQMSLSPVDLQWIDARKLSRSDICMYYGVPPSMIGDNSGSDSNWGTGLEQKSTGFQIYALEDDLTMWEEALTIDCLDDEELYVRINRAGLVRGDIKTRWGAYVQGLQWGVYSPNEIRALEDRNPREGGDIYYPPPNTAGKTDNPAKDD